MTISEAKRYIEEAIMRSNECRQPYRCRWHHRQDHGVAWCPHARKSGCNCYIYARALRTIIAATKEGTK